MIKINKYIDKDLSIYRNKKIVIWGAGDWGTKLIDLMKYFNINVVAFCDNDESKWGNTLDDIIIISPLKLKEMIEEDDDIVIEIGVIFQKSDNLMEQVEGLISSDRIYTYGAKNILGYLRVFEQTKKNSEVPHIHMIDHFAGMNDYIEDTIKSNDDFLFVSMPAKTGDFTINFTLENNNINYFNSWHRPERIDIDKLKKTGKNIKIITAVREPISQDLSRLYRWISTLETFSVKKGSMMEKNLENGMKQDLYNILENGGDAQQIFDEYIVKFDSISDIPIAKNKSAKTNIQNFIYRFEENIINITSQLFDKNKGCMIVKEGNIEVFVYTLEKLNSIVNELSEFLGVPFNNLEDGNLAERYWIAESYEEAKKELKFTQQYFNDCYNEPYVKHFYTDEQIEKFKNKWKNNLSK